MYCLLKSLQNPLQVCSTITSNLLKGNWSKKQLNFSSYPDHKHHCHLKRSVSAQRLQVAKYSSVIKMAKGLQPDWWRWVPRHSLHSPSLRYGLALGYQDWRDRKTARLTLSASFSLTRAFPFLGWLTAHLPLASWWHLFPRNILCHSSNKSISSEKLTCYHFCSAFYSINVQTETTHISCFPELSR